MTGLQLVTSICGGELQGAAAGSSSITLHTQQLTAGHYTADTKTAGSCCLLIQTALPCLLYASSAYDCDHEHRGILASGSGDSKIEEGTAKRMKSADGHAIIPGLQTCDNTIHEGITDAPRCRKQDPAPCTDIGQTHPQHAENGKNTETQSAESEDPCVYSTLKLIGGTDAAMAPPTGYVIDVLIPVFRKLYPKLDLSVSAEFAVIIPNSTYRHS